MGESRKLEAAEGLEDEAETPDLAPRPVGDVGEGAFADALARAPAFAQEDDGAGIAVGGDVDIHGNIYEPIQDPFCKEINSLARF